MKDLNVGMDVAIAKGNRLASVFKLLGAAVIGWEIGASIRNEFEVAEKAGIAFTGTVHAGFRKMQGYWEAFKATFTDDTISDAMARMEADVQHIQDEYQALFDEVDQRSEKAAAAQDKLADSTGRAGDAIEKTGQQAADAAPKLDALAGASVRVSEAATQISAANAMAAASYLTQIENAKTVNDVARLTATAMQELAGYTEAQALVSEAAAQKVADLDAASKSLAATQQTLSKTIVEVTDSIGDNYDAMLRLQTLYDEGSLSAGEFNDGISKLTDKNTELRDRQRDVNRALDENARASEAAIAATERNNASLETAISLTHVVRNNYYALSDAVGAYFDKTMRGVQSIEQWWDALSVRRFAQVQAQFDNLVLANDALIQRLRDGTASAQDMVSAQSALAFNVNATTHGMIALGQEQLNPLRAALADAQSRLESLRDSAESTLNSLSDELDRLNGNLLAIEQRNYEQKRLELQEKLAEAQAAGDAAAIAALQKSLAILQQIHEIKLKNLEADQAASRLPSSSSSASRGAADSGSKTGQNDRGDNTTQTARVEVDLKVNLDGKRIARVIEPYLSEFGYLRG